MISNFLTVISFTNYYCRGYAEIHFSFALKISMCLFFGGRKLTREVKNLQTVNSGRVDKVPSINLSVGGHYLLVLADLSRAVRPGNPGVSLSEIC